MTAFDRETAKEALALYDAQAADAKFLANLTQDGWARVSLSLAVEGYAPLRGGYEGSATPILNLKGAWTAHDQNAKKIAAFALSLFADGARLRMAERNRRLAQLGFQAWSAP